MENQISSKNLIITYGLILGLISVLLKLIEYAIGNHLTPHWSMSIVGLLVMISTIVMAIRTFKTANNGYINWGQSVKIGVGITVVSVVIVLIYQQFFNNFIEPDYMNQLLAIQEQALVDEGMSSDQIAASKEMMHKFKSPIMSSAIGLLSAAFLGFIVSAIIGAIMKKSIEE